MSKVEIKGADLPRYRCHKRVRAAKIKAIINPNLGIESEDDGERLLTFSGDGLEAAAFMVDAAWVRKHSPEVGGYYVVYDDGYVSFSPAKAFEDGYTRT